MLGIEEEAAVWSKTCWTSAGGLHGTAVLFMQKKTPSLGGGD